VYEKKYHATKASNVVLRLTGESENKGSPRIPSAKTPSNAGSKEGVKHQRENAKRSLKMISLN